MTGQRAAREPYTTRFETEVTAIDGRSVWLETSYFFGASGGQPADRGTIGDVAVEDVTLVDGDRVHVLAEEPSFKAGHRVLCAIDWSFRMYCMRAHTASHILSGAIERVTDDPPPAYAGLEFSDASVGVVLESDPFDDETLIALDELINRVVWESRPVSWDDLPIAQARERDDIAFDEDATADAVEAGRVRIVTIGDGHENGAGGPIPSKRHAWDVAVCSGTHVRNTREVGPVTVLGQSVAADRDEADRVRIDLAVGSSAIERRTAEKRAVFATTQALDVDIDGVPDELGRLDAP